MKILLIGDSIWHPCSLDIIEHKIISIRQFEGFNHYVLKSVRNVGACGRIEVIIDEHKGKLKFIELLEEENLEHASGLGDFIEGSYYANKAEAELEFYSQQEMLVRRRMERAEVNYETSVKNHERVKLIVDRIKETLKTC